MTCLSLCLCGLPLVCPSWRKCPEVKKHKLRLRENQVISGSTLYSIFKWQQVKKKFLKCRLFWVSCFCSCGGKSRKAVSEQCMLGKLGHFVVCKKKWFWSQYLIICVFITKMLICVLLCWVILTNLEFIFLFFCKCKNMFYTAHWEILLSWGVFFLHSLLNWPKLLQCVEELKIQLCKTQTICFIHPRCQTNSAELTLRGKNLWFSVCEPPVQQRRFSKSYIFLALYNRSPSCFWQKQSPLTVPPTACLNIRPNSAGSWQDGTVSEPSTFLCICTGVFAFLV